MCIYIYIYARACVWWGYSQGGLAGCSGAGIALKELEF